MTDKGAGKEVDLSSVQAMKTVACTIEQLFSTISSLTGYRNLRRFFNILSFEQNPLPYII